MSAYLADILGFKIGKKRLSIFRIRPKYVARISVSIAGAMIPLVTILLMSSSSSDFREWITRGREAIAEYKTAVSEKNQVQAELAANKKQLDDLGKRANELSKQYQTKVAEIAEQDRKIKVQTQKIREQEAKVSALNGQVQRIEQENKASKQELTTQKSLLVAEQDKLSKLRVERERLEKQKQISAKELENARIEGQDIKQKNLELDQENQNLQRGLAKIQSQLTELATELKTLKDQRDTAQTLSVEAQQQLKDLQASINLLKGDRDRYEEAVGNLKKTIDSYRQTPLTFVPNEEVTRMTVAAGLNLTEAKVLASALLRQARLSAEKRGAKYSFASVDDQSIRLFLRNGQGQVLLRSEEQLWPIIANQSRASVIVASAAFNFFQGEPVWLTFTQHLNPVVFQSGDVIAESRIDGKRSEGVIYSQVTEFLTSRVNDSAKKAKMIPVRIGYEESFGALGPEDLLAIVKQIHEVNRIVRIQAVTSEETRAGDRLRINLRIK